MPSKEAQIQFIDAFRFRRMTTSAKCGISTSTTFADQRKDKEESFGLESTPQITNPKEAING